LLIPISIGNKERKHICHNKPEKTTDSRKTLTGCGFFLFCRKNILCRSRYEKWEKDIIWFCTIKLENQTFSDKNNENSKKKSKLKQKNGLQMIFWGYNISE